jgi:hypothetical protein
MNRWTLYATDQVGVRQAQIDVYETAEVFANANDVSTWTLTLPTNTAAGQMFATNLFTRLEVAVDDVPWRSGPVTNLERTVDLDGDMLTVTGVDDTVWLARRNAHPQPGTAAPPYSTSAYDVHTGAVSTVLAELVRVNAGPSAVAARQVPGLTVPVPAPAGPTVTVNARWQNLLTLCQDTARSAGLLFDVVNLTFGARLPADNGVVFAAGLETLAAWTLTAPAPTANKVVVAGGGLLAARIIREVSNAGSIATWGLAETFVDRRDTTDTAQLDQAGTDSLAQSVTPTTVVFTPLDTPGQTFRKDWNLGDLVTVYAGALTVHDQVRQIHVTLDDNDATVVPSVGAPAGDLALFRSLAGLDRRVRQLERV